MMTELLRRDCFLYLLLLQEVLSHEDDSVLLKAYIKEWTKYFAQCSYLPLPFQAMETAMAGSKPTKKTNDGNRVNTVRELSGL